MDSKKTGLIAYALASVFASVFASTYAYALDNSDTMKALASQTSRPITVFKYFAQDEICDYPQPYIDGVAATSWQSDIHTRWPVSSRCASGSVQQAYVTFAHTLVNTTNYVIDYRNNTNACHLGNLATCQAAALNQASMIAHHTDWDGKMKVSAYPQGSTTERTISAQTMLAAGHWEYLLRGPLVTRVKAEDRSSARTYEFGWVQRRVVYGDIVTSYYIQAGDTSVAVINADHWSSISRPFKIVVDQEVISVCYVASNRIYFGLTNGSDASCANVNGRGQDGTSAVLHAGAKLFLQETVRLTSLSGNSLTVNDAGSITPPVVLQVGTEKINVCSKTSNTFTIGYMNPGCIASSSGRYYYGTNADTPQAFTPVYNWTAATDVWIDASANVYKSLHPMFVLTFYTGWAGVGIEYHIFNSWTDRLQDQEYTVKFYTGATSETLIHTTTHVRHVPGTGWKYPDGTNVGRFTGQFSDRAVWHGTAPAGLLWDRNLAYLRYAGAVPYDVSNVAISQSTIDSALTNDQYHSTGATYAWDNGSKGQIETGVTQTASYAANCAHTFRYLAEPGFRWDIGLHPSWMVIGLYAMGRTALTNYDRWQEWVLGSAACAGSIPYVFWEGKSTTLKFCNAGESTAQPTGTSCTGANKDVLAFGRVLSTDARPGLAYHNNQINATETVGSVNVATFNKWSMGDVNSHMPNLVFIPWLLTGDQYYWEIGAARASWTLWAANSQPNWSVFTTDYWNVKYAAKGSWRILGPIGAGGGPRNMAWGFRNLFDAAQMAKDGTPEKEWFTAVIKRNMAALEGKFNITDGLYYEPCPTTCQDDYSYWYYGRRRLGYALTSMGGPISLIDALGGAASNDGSCAVCNWSNTRMMTSYWSDLLNYHVFGDAYRRGFLQVTHVRKPLWKTLANVTFPPVTNPYMAGSYRMPGNACAPLGCGSYPFAIGQEFLFPDISTWWSDGVSTSGKTYHTEYDGGHDPLGRARIVYGAAAFAPDVLSETDHTISGKKLWEFVRGAVRYKNTADIANPAFIYDPQENYHLTLKTGAVGTTTATILFTRPEYTNTCYWENGTTFPSTTLTNTSNTATNSNGGRQISVALTGLTTATSYWFRATCGNARGYLQFTTN